MKSTSQLHIGIIMDGNGRWATRRGRPRAVGHRAGTTAVRRIVEAARERNVGALTLYAFSSDNWSRPEPEVRLLMTLFTRHLRTETARLLANDVRLEIIGRRDRMPDTLRAAIARAERATALCGAMHLRLAIDYSARAMIAAGNVLPDVDLVIRTGGEQRLSDFLLWESAYAELYFTPVMWPEFGAAELDAALSWFGSRERRFGGLNLGYGLTG